MELHSKCVYNFKGALLGLKSMLLNEYMNESINGYQLNCYY